MKSGVCTIYIQSITCRIHFESYGRSRILQANDVSCAIRHNYTEVIVLEHHHTRTSTSNCTSKGVRGWVSIISPSQSMRQPDYVNNCANSARNTVRPYASNSTQYLHYISFLPEKKTLFLCIASKPHQALTQPRVSEMTPCMPRALNNRHGYNEVNQTHSRANTKEHLLRVCIGGLDFLVTYILEL